MNGPSAPPTGEDDIRALDHQHVWHPYTQAGSASPPMVAVGGSGAMIIGDDGRPLLDLVSSWWVNLHGHAHPAIAAAIADQAATLEQALFADFTHAPAARLAARLAGLLPGDLDRVFYSDNGSTAVEVALKIALQYHANVGDGGRQRLIGFDRGYHGDTVGAMSLGRTSGYFRAWEGLLFEVQMVPFPATWIADDAVADREEVALAALDDALGSDVAAVIIEPLVQGAAGMRVCRPQFLRALAARVRAAGALLIFDEVMTGFGRTGGVFACTGADVNPDLICLSKGLTGGFLPMAVTVAREGIYQAFLGRTMQRAFLHGHSYTANPLGCRAALASLDLLLDTTCDQQRTAIEAIHRQRLAALADHTSLDQRRLCGTIAAVTLTKGADEALRVKDFFCREGALIRPLGAHLYFLPPYCIAASDLHRAWDLLEASLKQE